MRVVIQKVSDASVSVENKVIGQIGAGIVALCGFAADDTDAVLQPMLEKIINMRIFPDEKGRMHNSLQDVNGGLLLIPQFTLYADTSKGRRPEFFSAKAPSEASALFGELCRKAKSLLAENTQFGEFGAHMMLSLTNDGPVTISLEIEK